MSILLSCSIYEDCRQQNIWKSGAASQWALYSSRPYLILEFKINFTFCKDDKVILQHSCARSDMSRRYLFTVINYI